MGPSCQSARQGKEQRSGVEISIRYLFTFSKEVNSLSDYQAQDVGQQTADQLAYMGKKTGSKLAKAAKGKVGKWLKKMMVQFLRYLVQALLKILTWMIGPWGLVIVIAVLTFLAILSSIPGADWFLRGGSRTPAMIQQDTQYENQFIQLASDSVKEVDGYRALPDWKEEFKNLIKPSWGIPAALSRYGMIRTETDPTTFNNVVPTFSNVTGADKPVSGTPVSSFSVRATGYGADCGGCSGITATGINVKVSPLPKIIAVDPRVIPLHSQVELISQGKSLGVFGAEDTGGAIIGNHIDILFPSEKYAGDNWGVRIVTVKVLKWGGPSAGPIGTWAPTTSGGLQLPDPAEMYQQLKPEFHYKSVSSDVDRWKIVTTICGKKGCHTTITYQTRTRPAHKVLDWVWTPYGDVHVPSLKKYWTGYYETDKDWAENRGSVSNNKWVEVVDVGMTGQDVKRIGMEKVQQIIAKRNSNDSDDGSSMSINVYYQYENTEVDDRGLSSYKVDAPRLRSILLSRGVKEVDIPIMFQFAAAADPADQDIFFYAGQFDGVNSNAKYTDYKNIVSTYSDYEFHGEMKNGWVWPLPQVHVVTDVFGPRWGTFHYGTDLGGSAGEGTPVVAARAGKVIRAEFSTSYGNVVYLLHPDGLETRYAHMQNGSLRVHVGQGVKAGDMLGLEGRTGDVTGPHLHFEVMKPGNSSPMGLTRDMDRTYDPLLFIGSLK